MNHRDLASTSYSRSARGAVVLVVDDDLSFRLMLSTSLGRAGFEVIEAADAWSAMEAFDRVQPDVVLLDVMMPKVDGFEVCEALRATDAGRYTPIIMLTNLDDPESIERAYEVGASDFVTKPVDIIILRHRLHYLLRAYRYLMHIDELTGLPNRSLLLEQLEIAIDNAKRRAASVAVLLIDLDQFKRVTETLGYETGDRILRSVADRLVGSLRSGDYVARTRTSGLSKGEDSTLGRLGGDQFVVVLPAVTNLEDVAAVARRLRDELKEPFETDGTELYITASMGISAFPLDGDDPQSLILDAEMAMNDAKSQGRDRHQFYTERLNAQTRRSFSIESHLRKAIEADELQVFFQPKVDIQQNRVAGLEALLRWSSSELGEVAPLDFIAIAEQTGLILPLGEQVVAAACEHMATLSRAGIGDLTLAINLSAAQFKQKQLAERIRELIESSGFDPGNVEMELTEGLLLEDIDTSIRTLNEFNALGISVSLDDFGTGYSSLSYLKKLPLRALKIDKSFIQDLTTSRDDAVIVEAIIALGHTLNLEVIAEGVEDESQLDFLKERHCDQVQGYFFSRALPPDAVYDWVQGFPH